MRGHNAVRGVGAGDIKVPVLKPTLSFVEHIECLRLVLFYRGNCFLKQSLGFFGSAILGRPTRSNSGKEEKRQKSCKPKHGFLQRGTETSANYLMSAMFQQEEAPSQETRGLSRFRWSGTYDGGDLHRCVLRKWQIGVINPSDEQSPAGKGRA